MHFNHARSCGAALSVALLSSSVLASPTPIDPRATTTKYIINFGDSYSQTGFNASVGPLPSANNLLGNPPFPGFTTANGNRQNWLDSLITQHNTTLTLAANLAVGGATTDANLVTPFAPFPQVYSFVDQVGDFMKFLHPAPASFPWTAQQTLFSVFMGVNDVGNGWFQSNWAQLSQQVVARQFGLVENLYQAGARKFLFLTVPPIYLTPLVQSSGSAGIQGLQAAIPQFNNLITSHVANFTRVHPDVKTWTFDTSSSFANPVANPRAFGAQDATCFSESGTQCLWFNDYHPGQIIHDQVSKGVGQLIGNF